MWGRDTGSFFLQHNTLHHHVFDCFVFCVVSPEGEIPENQMTKSQICYSTLLKRAPTLA